MSRRRKDEDDLALRPDSTPPDELRGPRHKSDFAAVERLEALAVADWAHLVPDVLTWLQDANFPVCPAVERLLLLQDPADVVEPVRDVIRGDDPKWQVNCLSLLERMPPDVVDVLRDNLIQLKERSDEDVETNWDMTERVDRVLAGLD